MRARTELLDQTDDERICPRCGMSGYKERVRKGSNTYIVYVHRKVIDGKRFQKKCYVGAERYIYVNQFNDIGLTGLHDKVRYMKYINTILSKISEEGKVSLISELFKEMSDDALWALATKLIEVIDSRKQDMANNKAREGKRMNIRKKS